jgi:hypothetical protein
VRRPAYKARAFVSHLPGKERHGLCGHLIEPGHPVAVTDDDVDCNRCQRLDWAAKHPKPKRKPKPKARWNGRQYANP